MKKIGLIVILFLGIAFLFTGNVFAENSNLVAKVVSVEGKVFIKDAKENLITVKQGMLISEGTKLISQDNSYVQIVLNEAVDANKVNAIRIQAQSEIVLTKLNPLEIALNKGKLFFFVRDLKKGQTFEVRTPICVAGVRGTDGAVEIGSTKVWNFSKDSKIYIHLKDKPEEIFWLNDGYKTVK